MLTETNDSGGGRLRYEDKHGLRLQTVWSVTTMRCQIQAEARRTTNLFLRPRSTFFFWAFSSFFLYFSLTLMSWDLDDHNIAIIILNLPCSNYSTCSVVMDLWYMIAKRKTKQNRSITKYAITGREII